MVYITKKGKYSTFSSSFSCINHRLPSPLPTSPSQNFKISSKVVSLFLKFFSFCPKIASHNNFNCQLLRIVLKILNCQSSKNKKDAQSPCAHKLAIQTPLIQAYEQLPSFFIIPVFFFFAFLPRLQLLVSGAWWQ